MAKIFISTIVPGLLVNIKTSIKGNVSYDKSDEKVVNKRDGVEITSWETERTIKDPEEQKAATEIRSKACNLVISVCARSEFGLLCPDSKRADLDKAFTEARKLCTEFNATAKTTRVKFNAIAGHIAADDLNAVRAINSEVRDLLGEMKAGIKTLDVERVRDAANRTKRLGTMLAPDVQARIEETLKVVRAQASKIVKAGDQAATAIDKETIKALNVARTAFLDLDAAAEIQAPADTSGRALDLTPSEPASATNGTTIPMPELDFV
jgi:hypothetical protein